MSLTTRDLNSNAVALGQVQETTVDVAIPVLISGGGGGTGTPVDVAVTNFPAVQSVDDNGGSLTIDGTVIVSNLGAVATEVQYADSANLDAFSRLRVSQPNHVFNAISLYDTEPGKMGYLTTGTGVAGTFNATNRVTELTVAAGTGTSIAQSYQYINYQPGRSHLVLMTFVMDAVATSTMRVGYFDAGDGVFLERDASGDAYVVLRSSVTGAPVDTRVVQASWNISTLGILDLSKAQILFIDLQYLGMGRVRVGFDIDGIFMPVHEFLNANNVLALPYMRTASLPIRFENDMTAGAGASTLKWKCCAVASEGGRVDFNSRVFSTGEGIATAANGSRTLILSFRPRATGIGGIAARNFMRLTNFNLLVTGNNPVFWEMCAGGTMTPGAFTDVNTTYSNYQYASAGTYTNLTGGIVLESGYAAATNQVKTAVNQRTLSDHPCSLDAAGANSAFLTYYVLVTGIGGTSACRASFDFTEA